MPASSGLKSTLVEETHIGDGIRLSFLEVVGVHDRNDWRSWRDVLGVRDLDLDVVLGHVVGLCSLLWGPMVSSSARYIPSPVVLRGDLLVAAMR